MQVPYSTKAKAARIARTAKLRDTSPNERAAVYFKRLLERHNRAAEMGLDEHDRTLADGIQKLKNNLQRYQP